MIQELFDAVQELNDIFFRVEAPMDSYDSLRGFTLESDGFQDAVFFMGVRVWTDDDDTREFDEDRNEYEPYKTCFAREALYVVDRLMSVRREIADCAGINPPVLSQSAKDYLKEVREGLDEAALLAFGSTNLTDYPDVVLGAYRALDRLDESLDGE